MKKLLLIAFVLTGCQASVNQHNGMVSNDSLSTDTLSTIEFMCMDANSQTFTPEEAAHWDSMNANGGFLLIRGAERYLDTIVNHYHFIFIPEP